MKQLEYLSKEEILKRFVSLEFNRFLEYYKNAEDLNLPDRASRSDERGERGERGEKRGRKSGIRVRLKINLGSRDGINPKRILGIINDVTDDKSINVGDIDITNKFTFFDVFEDQSEQVLKAFEAAEDMEVSLVKGNRANDESGSGKRKQNSRNFGGDRKSFGDKRNDDRKPSRDRKSDGRDRSSSKSGKSDRKSFYSGGTTNSEKPWRRNRR